MMYWIILIALAALILVTIIVTIVTIVKERKEYKRYEFGDEDGMDADDEEDEEYDERPAKKRRNQAKEKPGKEKQPSKAVEKRRWKIILENPDTSERYSFIFYDTVGIGRTTKEVAFEKFLSLPDDKRISKVHCSIVRSQDKLYLRDEGSKNHTYLNGKRVQKPVLIQKEDMISVGATDLEVIKILRETS